MTLITNFEYTTVGNVKVKNYVASVDKRNGYVVIEFDARGKDWTAGSPYPQAFLRYSGADKTTVDLKDLTNQWKRYRLEWYAASEIDNKNWGDITITLKIQDEHDNTQTFDMQGIELDFDPAEFHLELIEEVDFGVSFTPAINFSLKPLHNKNQKMDLVTTNTSTGAEQDMFYVYTESGTSILLDYVVVLDGVKFSESNLTMNSTEASYAYWSKVTKYAAISPSLTAGQHHLSVDLRCTNL